MKKIYFLSICVISYFCNGGLIAREINPLWIDKWIVSCHLCNAGKLDKAEKVLSEAISIATKTKNTNAAKVVHRITTDLISCKMMNGKNFTEILSSADPIINCDIMSRASSYRINLLKNLVKFGKKCDADVSKIEEELQMLEGSFPSIYLLEDVLFLFPINDSLGETGRGSVIKSIEKILDNSGSEESIKSLIAKGTFTSSGVFILEMSDELKDKLGKAIEALILDLRHSPLLFPANTEKNLIVFHNQISTSSPGSGLVKKLYSSWVRSSECYKKSISSENKGELVEAKLSIMSALESATGISAEFECRLLIELAILDFELGNEKEAKLNLKKASRIDKKGKSRSTYLALMKLLYKAVESENISLVRQVFLYAENGYALFPKILGIFGNVLIIESPSSIEEKMSGIGLMLKYIGMKKPSFPADIPYELMISPSGGVCLWIEFEKNVMSIPSIGVKLKALKTVGNISSVVGGWFGIKKGPVSPREVGLLGLLIGKDTVTDI